MRVLVLGATGMLGYQLFKNCLIRDISVNAIVRRKKDLVQRLGNGIENKLHIIDDVKNTAAIERIVSEFKPDYLINCVGIIKQSNLAYDYYESIAINSLLPHQLLHLGSLYNFRLIHISTDCVFNGNNGNYKETDFSDAFDLYGKSKFLGEVAYGSGITLRTSIIGHAITEQKVSLIDWFLSQTFKTKGYVKAIFSGLTTLELSKVILDIIIAKKVEPGLYQIASETISKFDLLRLTAEIYKKEILIEASEDVIIDRSLNGTKFSDLTSYLAPSWSEMLEEMHADYINNYI
jgi:dTDP-4-dehydrorhamnose reductase